MGRVRGTSVLGTIAFLRSSFGDQAADQFLSSRSSPLREALGIGGSTLLPHGWYECSAVSELTREMDREFGKGDLALARAVGKHVAFTDVNRFFQWLLKLTGPRTLFARAGSVWKNYYDTGSYVLESVSDLNAVIRIEGWDSADEVLCRRIEGWIERGFELTIGKAVHPVIRETHHQVRDVTVSKHAFCRFVVDWDR